MTEIFATVEAALKTLSPSIPYAAGVYVPASGSALPDVFLTYTLISDEPLQHGDDAETENVARVQVTIWSRTGLNSVPAVEGAMLAAGFMRSRKRQLPTSEDTRHFGLAIEFTVLN